MANSEKLKMADLTGMSLAELKSLQGKVAKAIQKVEQKEKKKALAQLKAKAEEMGFSLDDLVGFKKSGGKTARRAGVAKYRNPDNPAQTWTGKGRRPGWVLDALKAGKSVEDLAI